MSDWAFETDTYETGVSVGLRIRETLYDEVDPLPLQVYATEEHGRALMLDGYWMCAEGDEANYHEFLVYTPVTRAERLERVLVIGGGDGGTVKRLQAFDSITRIDWVEIDRRVVDLCREWLPALAPDWDDPRINLIIDDGANFVAGADDATYDVILTDATSFEGPAAVLYSDAYFRNCARILRPGGTYASHIDTPATTLDKHADAIARANAIFGFAAPYYSAQLVYPADYFGFVLATNDPAAPQRCDAERLAQIPDDTNSWNADISVAAFAAPQQVRSSVREHGLDLPALSYYLPALPGTPGVDGPSEVTR